METMAEKIRRSGLKPPTVYMRLKRGWALEDALGYPPCGPLFPDNVRDFIAANVRGRTTRELADMVNDRFRTSFSPGQIKYFKRSLNLKSGVDTHTKKGGRSLRQKPVGAEKVLKSGYVIQKIGEPDIWRLKHHILYEQYHGTKLPKGACVIFLDGSPLNFEKCNLHLMTRREVLYLLNHGLRFPEKDLMLTCVMIARLGIATEDKEREGRDGE